MTPVEPSHGGPPEAGTPMIEWNGPVATMYAALVAVRNAELQAHWARYNIQSVLNLGFGLAVFGAGEKSFIHDHQPLMAAAGLILSLLWLGFAIESKRILTDRWDYHLRLFEGQYQQQLPYKLFRLVEAVERTWSARALTFLQRLLPGIFIVAWLSYWWSVGGG
jgi:hypothetical protein